MSFVMDVRYLVPPFVSLSLVLFISQDKPWADQDVSNMAIGHPAILLMVVAASLILLFLFISLKLSLTLESIHLRVGDFSVPLTLSMVASLILSLSRFWVVFPILVIVSPWYPMLLDVFERFIYWFYHSLQKTPTLIIQCITQHQEEFFYIAPDPDQDDIELAEI